MGMARSQSTATTVETAWVAYLLFMVSTTFERESVLKVDLPEASAVEEREELPDMLELVIDGETGVFFREQTPASLRDAVDRFLIGFASVAVPPASIAILQRVILDSMDILSTTGPQNSMTMSVAPLTLIFLMIFRITSLA